MRLLLKFLSLDIVPFMVVKYPGDFMGKGRVVLSGALAPSKEIGVILWDVRSPFCSCCCCFVLFFKLHQMRDSRLEPWEGRLDNQKSGLNLGPRDLSSHYGI